MTVIVRNLTKQFQEQTVLSNVSFQVDQGEFIALVGASGSGKSTLLRCLYLTESWTKGEYIIDGKNVAKANALEKMKYRKHWAFLEEKPAINPGQTALKNVLGARWQHMSIVRSLTRKASMDEHVLAMDFLEKVGLLDKAEMKADKLSGGEQQRVVIAKALVQEATVILADDPVKGLAPDAAARVMEDLRSVSERQNVTVICALNQLELAERYAKRIWGLAEGRIVVDVPARKLTMRERSEIL